jgi:hypothetical protein
LTFGPWNFGFLSDFVLRISDLECPSSFPGSGLGTPSSPGSARQRAERRAIPRSKHRSHTRVAGTVSGGKRRRSGDPRVAKRSFAGVRSQAGAWERGGKSSPGSACGDCDAEFPLSAFSRLSVCHQLELVVGGCTATRRAGLQPASRPGFNPSPWMSEDHSRSLAEAGCLTPTPPLPPAEAAGKRGSAEGRRAQRAAGGRPASARMEALRWKNR